LVAARSEKIVKIGVYLRKLSQN